jgi:hypothetical protein
MSCVVDVGTLWQPVTTNVATTARPNSNERVDFMGLLGLLVIVFL